MDERKTKPAPVEKTVSPPAVFAARRLPPLNALRAFEAAARHLSFTRAATELNVTPGAVSQHVRGLEEWLQIKLFRRSEAGLTLTAAGILYMRPISGALDQISDATRRLRPRTERSHVLVVTTTPAFAMKWLLPRLPRFHAAYPGVDVRLSATNTRLDFQNDNVDVAVRLGHGNWTDGRVRKLFSEDVYPVCSPALLTCPHPLRSVEDLRHHTLLHDDSVIDWRIWLRAAGLTDLDWVRGPSFTDSAMQVQAAVNGQGVALAQHVLVMDDIAEGRLVKPFDLMLQSSYGHYLVVPFEAPRHAETAAMCEWLIAEAKGPAGV